MTIEEQLKNLTERHEALTGHVEMLTMDITRMRGILDDMMVGIAKLAHVADVHERRLERLEAH